MDVVKLIAQYKYLGINEVIDHEKFNLISIVHHSTRIEGSTLTAVETQVLINEGLTPKGKPLHESLMVTDHFAALDYALVQAREKRVITSDYYQALIDTRKEEDISIFRKFMDKEYQLLLGTEITKFKEMQHPKKVEALICCFNTIAAALLS